MKKTNISIMYDDEKLNAIRLYMSQRDLDFKEEFEKSVDSLYPTYRGFDYFSLHFGISIAPETKKSR